MATSAKRIAKEQVLSTPTQLAEQAYQETGEAAAAANYMFETVWNDPALRQNYMERAFRNWCSTTVHSYVNNTFKKTRLATVSAPSTSAPTPVFQPVAKTNQSSRKARVFKNIYDTPWWGGQALGDFTKNGLLEGARSERRFVAAAEEIASLMKSRQKTVRECVEEGKLEKLLKDKGVI